MIRNAESAELGHDQRTVAARQPRSDSSSTARTLTEDEADVLFAEKHKDDKRHPLRKVIQENGDSDLLVGRDI